MITKEQISNFKTLFCLENLTVVDIIKTKLKKYFLEPILDVGCGMGDIASNALSDKVVFLVDKIDFGSCETSSKHIRVTMDFFNYTPPVKINTLFLSHAIQFLDDNVTNLNKKIRDIDPIFVILVANKNNDILGEVISYVNKEGIRNDAEVEITNFPYGYNLVDEISFSVELVCPTIEVLADQISYIMVVHKLSDKMKLLKYLKGVLSTPKVIINQKIEIYKNENK